jgi:hypothetical protein
VIKAQFDEILKAARDIQVSQFILGDALKKACPISRNGVNNESGDKLLEVREKLAEEGIDYDIEMLRKLRRVSDCFPADRLDKDGNLVKAG